MQEKRPENVPEVMTAYRLILLILLWVFILLWISPLASFAALPSETDSDSPSQQSRSIPESAVDS